MSAKILIITICIFMCGCGYSKEEKKRMENIETLGIENAQYYVKEKYGFIPQIDDVKICMEQEDGDSLPWANGYVLASASFHNKKFKVHINGESATLEGQDDFQKELIMKEGREYFESLLGYEIYDMYLEYTEKEESGSNALPCHKAGMLGKMYESGNFEQFLHEHPINVRIDDCTDQDLTKLGEENPGAVEFFGKYAADYGMKAILISYKSREDYERGYDHTYGNGGVMDFQIWNDGLYINSYGIFEEDKQDLNRFKLLEQDGVIFGCLDRPLGDNLEICTGKRQWMELGETKGMMISQVFSADRDEKGEITVFIPVNQYGGNISVFIQHFDGNKWRQYEANKKVTKNKEYAFVTYHGIPDSHFDLAIFDGEDR